MLKILKLFFQSFLWERGALRFAVMMTLGLAFSIAVILGTIGIMEGFEWSLKKGLKHSMGDIYFFSHEGFFPYPGEMQGILADIEVKELTPLIHTEAFVIFNEQSKGALLKGVETESFKKVTGIELGKLEGNEVVIGSKLAELFKIKKGDNVALGLANGHQGFSGLPLLFRAKVVNIISHGVYEKDLRYVYLPLKVIQKLLQVEGKINVISLNAPYLNPDEKFSRKKEVQNIENFLYTLNRKLGNEFRIRPFWSEFSGLFKAVEAEKVMLGLVLQVIVVIAIFNVLAFIVFINEKRAQELFMFKALGLSQSDMSKGWMGVILLVWAVSCILATGMVQAFNLALNSFEIFHLPGDIYYLERLSILLDAKDYVLVFSLSLLWLILLSFFGLRRLKKRPLLQGLRKEFA